MSLTDVMHGLTASLYVPHTIAYFAHRNQDFKILALNAESTETVEELNACTRQVIDHYFSTIPSLSINGMATAYALTLDWRMALGVLSVTNGLSLAIKVYDLLKNYKDSSNDRYRNAPF
jgi:hypothetical protein